MKKYISAFNITELYAQQRKGWYPVDECEYFGEYRLKFCTESVLPSDKFGHALQILDHSFL
jgi:hypothetical protein